MNRKILKLNICFILVIIIAIFSANSIFTFWGQTEKGGIYWYESDGTVATDGWKLIDDNNDGIYYYYYFDEKGFLVLDDITPDLKIVGADGKRIGYDGNPEFKVIEKSDFIMEEGEEGIYSAEILNQIKEAQVQVSSQKGSLSSGEYIFVKDKTETDGPKPSDGLIIENNIDGSARYLLGPNVVLKKEKKDDVYDPTLDKKMNEYIKTGDKYSKKVNGTTFNKSKWKDVMALKGTGATIVFENPNHNFNKLKGRIATHYFTYSDRTTQCTFSIYNEDDGEELYSTSDFNYNAGVSFECVFPKKASAIRFELEVSGQYTSRVCYLRGCEFLFDKEAYEEELYDDEVNQIYLSKIGTQSDADYEDESDDLSSNGYMGEIALEGEDPVSRYRRIHGIQDDDYYANFEYDEDDDTITDSMRASISQAKRKKELEEQERNLISGPAFDPKLNSETVPLGPNGASRIISGVVGEED